MQTSNAKYRLTKVKNYLVGIFVFTSKMINISPKTLPCQCKGTVQTSIQLTQQVHAENAKTNNILELISQREDNWL